MTVREEKEEKIERKKRKKQALNVTVSSDRRTTVIGKESPATFQ
jgi:hypothetical protein